VRTALDTNVISSIWSGEASEQAIRIALREAAAVGGLVLCPAVYGELRAYPGVTHEFLDTFLAKTRIAVDWELDGAVWRLAAERFAHYAERRRRSGSGMAKRLLADFIVGAHAVLRADRLMTLDRGRYERDFSELAMI
jgi:hypothetical protein